MEQARMTSRIRPEFVEVAVWDDLRKIARKFRDLADTSKFRHRRPLDIAYLKRCAEQADAVVQQMSEGSMSLDHGIDWVHFLDNHYDNVRAVTNARPGKGPKA